MFTLVFLVCNTATGNCYSAAPPTLFQSVDACQQAAAAIIDDNYKRQKAGLADPEQAAYQCVGWGEPT
jgi:hypothetical protein